MAKTVFIKDTAITGKDRTRDFYGVFLGVLREKGVDESVQPVRVADIGEYGQGIVVRVVPDNFLYTQLNDGDIPAIVESIKTGKPYEAKLAKQGARQMRAFLPQCFPGMGCQKLTGRKRSESPQASCHHQPWWPPTPGPGSSRRP